MLHQTYIINICIRIFCFRNNNRFIPKLKIVNAVIAFSNGKKRFSVGCFNTRHQEVFIIPFYGACI